MWQSRGVTQLTQHSIREVFKCGPADNADNAQCCLNGGPAMETLVHHLNSIGSASRTVRDVGLSGCFVG